MAKPKATQKRYLVECVDPILKPLIKKALRSNPFPDDFRRYLLEQLRSDDEREISVKSVPESISSLTTLLDQTQNLVSALDHAAFARTNRVFSELCAKNKALRLQYLQDCAEEEQRRAAAEEEQRRVTTEKEARRAAAEEEAQRGAAATDQKMQRLAPNSKGNTFVPAALPEGCTTHIVSDVPAVPFNDYFVSPFWQFLSHYQSTGGDQVSKVSNSPRWVMSISMQQQVGMLQLELQMMGFTSWLDTKAKQIT